MKSFSELPDYREMRRLWKQEPIERPTPDLELTQDSWVERGAEVVGWWLALLEFWLSENGWLRAWLRLNLIVSIVLTSAGVLLLPPVSRVLEHIANSSHWLSKILSDLFIVITSLPPVAVSVGVLYLGFLLYRRIRRRRLGNRGYQQEDHYQ
ncbi:hypothetical protein VSU19_22245 [Verrucomicrobiales bacterium BCK34]|nr:hypothetical protein [Verrucomicrobiales bacterium BCK34]